MLVHWGVSLWQQTYCHSDLYKAEPLFKAKQVMMYTNPVLHLVCVCVFMCLSVCSCLLEGEESTWQELLCHCWDLSFLCLDALCSAAAMSYRTVVMYMEIGCFVLCVSGWILVCSTMPTEIWTWSEVDSIVLTTSNYFSNLWKDCISDSTGVSDCKGIPSMLALNCK